MSDIFHGFSYAKDAGNIVTVTMNMDGPVNAMNGQFRAAMAVMMNKLESEDALAGLVLTSAKKTFFAGGDLRELSSVPKGQEESQFRMIEDDIKAPLRRLEKLQVPVVAAINGAALGGGLEICLACNHRISWDSSSVVVGFPEVSLGLLPGGGGVVRSIHMLGLERALPFLLEGTKLNAKAALEAGFVDQLTHEAEALVPMAKAWIRANPGAWEQPWDRKGHKIPYGDIWNPAITNILSIAPALTFKKTRGLLPAPERILAVAGDTLAVDFDSALRIESRGLAFLITTKEAKNIITSSFFQMNTVNSGASRPKGFEITRIKKVGVLGAGVMGQGIAYSSALAGIEVVLIGSSLENAEKGKAYAADLLDQQIKLGRKTEEEKASILSLIKASSEYADLTGSDLILEALTENAEIKASATKEAEPFLTQVGIFASATSALPVSQLAQASLNPEKFIGIHFSSPADKTQLIEIICSETTSDETLAKAFDYARQMRKTVVVVNDSPGFFSSRVFNTYLDEGARLLKEGLDPVLIDNIGLQVGMPAGPLATQDEFSQTLTRQAFETSRLISPCDSSANIELSQLLISEYGRGGRHQGGGYYEYSDAGTKTIWPKLYELFHKPGFSLPTQDIKDRILFRQAIESLKCLEDGVLRSVAEGNIGSLLGSGAPTWTGGFLQMVNTYEHKGDIGPAAFATRAKELTEQYGDRFLLPAIVLKKIRTNEYFV